MTKKIMPIGISDFGKVINGNYYFVDKSLIIKDILNHQYEVMMFTRPRRFGKTITMRMLQYYFDCEHAETNKELFARLAIARQGAKYLKEQGQYPVIFLSFKDAKMKNWEECYKIIYQIIRAEFDRFSYVLKSDKLTEREKNYMRQVIDGNADQSDMVVSLSILTKILSSHYGNPPILLIDEYDEPIQAGYSHNYYDQVIDFMRVFLSGGLKDNPHLKFAVMTGILRVAKESIFSGLNNLMMNTILSEQYSDYFGFTESEVRDMAIEQGCEERLPEIKAWYDGYKFGSKEIYNPWSLLNYFSHNCKAAPYWLNTSSNDAIRILLKNANSNIREKLESLLNEQNIISEIEDQIVYTDIEKSTTTLFTFLVMTGYLKILADRSFLSEFPQYELAIPNREIRRVYQVEILENMKESLPKEELMPLLMYLLEGKKERFETGLQNILLRMASSFDGNESFYHGFILGITALLLGSYTVKSNHESGYGRFDIGIYPMDTNKAGAILEFKHCSNESELERKAKDAYQQILVKKYDADFKMKNISHVFFYGIAFYGKRVKVFAESYREGAPIDM